MKTPGLTAAYAFVQYEDITCVVKALKDMDGKTIGENPLKVGALALRHWYFSVLLVNWGISNTNVLEIP